MPTGVYDRRKRTQRMRACCPNHHCKTYGNLLVTQGNGYFVVRCPLCGPVRRSWSPGASKYNAEDLCDPEGTEW